MNQVRKLHQQMREQQRISIEDQVYNDLADSMLGKDCTDEPLRQKKIKDLKQGKYKDMFMTIYPKQLKLWPNATESSYLTATVDEIQYSLFEIYQQRNKMHEKSLDLEKETIEKVESEGIVFIDEIDKLTFADKHMSTRAISREGVQKDLLPIIEGTVIATKIGDIKTDHILFIASGAFSMAKVDDLIPQLLGRLPIRVSMNPITESEFYRILTQPKYNILLEQQKLLEQQGIDLQFTTDAISEIARFAAQMNTNHENMGARRLQSIIEKVIEDLSFDAPSHHGSVFRIDCEYVKGKLNGWDHKILLNKYLI